MERNPLAMRLKVLRAMNGDTQESLASSIGIDKRTVSRYELGDAMPSIINAWKIADRYGCTIDALVGRE